MSLEEIAMGLIVGAGTARSEAREAIRLARSGNLEAARERLQAAGAAMIEAHHIQTDLIQAEAAGSQTPINLLLIHAQDHLMNAITIKEMAEEFIELYASRKPTSKE
jgi:PTS system cellobiose-specific IIA component